MRTTIRIYATYSFKTKDPVIDQLRTMTDDGKVHYVEAARTANLSPTTVYGWFHGKTRRPQSASVEAYGRALGFKRDWVKINLKTKK